VIIATSRYRDPAHQDCNLQNSFYILVVFYNLSGYDTHFIIKEIAIAYEGCIDIFLITKEKYISFTKHVNSTKNEQKKTCIKLCFIDSCKFLASLEKLTSYLDKDKSKITQSEFLNLSAEDFDLLTRKDIFLYEYIDCVEKLEETELPSRNSFYSSLMGDGIRERLYACHVVTILLERVVAILHSNITIWRI